MNGWNTKKNIEDSSGLDVTIRKGRSDVCVFRGLSGESSEETIEEETIGLCTGLCTEIVCFRSLGSVA